MLKIEAHFSAKGRFYAVSFKLSYKAKPKQSQQTKNYQTQTAFVKKSSSLGISNRLFLIIIFLLAIFSSFLDLQLCGGVEISPGRTYDIKKVVMGRVHQGDSRFGLTTDIQCAFVSLYALCLSHVKKVSRYNTHDLDHILN